MTASRPLALRRAEELRIAARARRRVLHLAKMMVQDETEKMNKVNENRIMGAANVIEKNLPVRVSKNRLKRPTHLPSKLYHKTRASRKV